MPRQLIVSLLIKIKLRVRRRPKTCDSGDADGGDRDDNELVIHCDGRGRRWYSKPSTYDVEKCAFLCE